MGYPIDHDPEYKMIYNPSAMRILLPWLLTSIYLIHISGFIIVPTSTHRATIRKQPLFHVLSVPKSDDTAVEDDFAYQRISDLARHIGRTRNRWKESEVDTPTLKKSYYTLLYLLRQERETIPFLREEVKHDILQSCIQGIRAMKECRDYRSILSVAEYHTDPRVGCEALEALGQISTAGASKLYKVWNLFHPDRITSREVNTMMRSLHGKQKVRAALDFFKRFPSTKWDSYTASVVLEILADSVSSGNGDTYWQWEEALEVLDLFEEEGVELNNYVYAKALKVNEELMSMAGCEKEVYDGANSALQILDRMKKNNINPDIITCSCILTAFHKAHDSKNAIQFLNAMTSPNNSTTFKLPPPNIYSYTTTLSACAKSHQPQAAFLVLERMLNDDVEPNAWVYNTALTACQSLSGWGVRTDASMAILHHMRELADTITYNSVLGAIAGKDEDVPSQDDNLRYEDIVPVMLQEKQHDTEELDKVIVYLLEEMKEKNIPMDSITYHNAILACQHCSSPADTAIPIFRRALQHNFSLQQKTFLMNSVLYVCARHPNSFSSVVEFLNEMDSIPIPPNHHTFYHLIEVMGNSGQNCTSIMDILGVMKGHVQSQENLLGQHGLAYFHNCNAITPIQEIHYSAAIAASVQNHQFDLALKLLSQMKLQENKPTRVSLLKILKACCRTAMHPRDEKVGRVAAETALSIYQLLNNETKTMSSHPMTVNVMKSCAMNGLWDDALSLLSSLYRTAVDGQQRDWVSLHRYLLSVCATQGNIDAAMNIADIVQNFASSYSETEYKSSTNSNDEQTLSVSSILMDQNDVKTITSNGTKKKRPRIGMRTKDWKILLSTASKAKHWRTCLNTFYFLQPYMEKTKRSSQQILTKTILCFESCGQYAWTLRVIQDWMQWNPHALPNSRSVLSACRLLAAKGHGQQVVDLLTGILLSENGREITMDYKQKIFVGGITALYRNGLYDYADELYLMAVQHNTLPSPLVQTEETISLDLHGMTTAVARSAVRTSFQQKTTSPKKWTRDVTIITGKGKNSSQKLRPVLRPEVQRMLTEEFYPPLNTFSISGNMGALCIPARDVRAYVAFQREQRGVRMMHMADLLRGVSDGKRLKKGILKIRGEEEE